ncbi:hypothetical protein AMS68_001428 [Peltaster fructicola]|uniref:Enoyl reductase (ER) domain-containing protein n=1 Tax=Peltaster fructicola TaxID=286661 RepID=A0A6H0XMP1_9PEZI|nr:hypothetical protein AMS68_001428 [Peltaster fructicola]
MKALKCVATDKIELQDVPLPKLRDDYILVKVNAVALNPTDWKHVASDGLANPGSTVGCDFAGIVEEVGSKVSQPLKKGDRICGWTHGVNKVNKEDGSFAEYAMVKGDVFIKTPDNLSDEEASTLGIGITTVGQNLYQELGLPLPGEGPYNKPVLIYGGSTATGTLAVQYAKLSGAKVIATCSPRNFDLLKSLGAEATFDYNDPECAKKIREYTNDSLDVVLDCIAEGDSPKICEEAIGAKGGAVAGLLPTKHERKDVKTKGKLGYTVMGEAFPFFGNELPAMPQDREFGQKFWSLSEKLLSAGSVKVHPTDVRKGGLEGVKEGLAELKSGKVSGVKLVYKIAN